MFGDLGATVLQSLAVEFAVFPALFYLINLVINCQITKNSALYDYSSPHLY